MSQQNPKMVASLLYGLAHECEPESAALIRQGADCILALAKAGEHISWIAGQMDAHQEKPVQISYEAIISLRLALAQAEGR